MKVTLNWAAYFRRFCEAHGEPVKYRGRLLFRDGFMYSAHSYSGPEYWPAPEDVERLQRAYWACRAKMVRVQLKELLRDADSVVRAQYGRSVPLQQTVSFIDDDGKRVVTADNVDHLAITERIEWLKSEYDKSLEELANVGNVPVG